jgi:D-alanyl-lipoteichoic acid acyltransferase DltB (MBOAT superfamily)
MSFASFDFLLFFPITTAVYFLVPWRARWVFMLLASCAFYMFFVPSYILILLFTIAVDYVAGILIESAAAGRRRLYLGLSIVANVGVLAVFKYYNFAIGNLNALSRFFHVSADLPLLHMVLPIGLSFHTFQAMSYTIEVYRGNQRAERHLGIYALYVMFYPQLVAGPIERPQNMLHQFHEHKTFDYGRFVSGLRLMLWGFFKKLVVADGLATLVNGFYLQPRHYPGLLTLVAVAAFAFQVYGDFSGYSDIARGSARVMGFELMRNFDIPFRSKSIAEFWRRWHISLSTWFNDYLFTPLYTGLRYWGRLGLAIALFTTFLCAGIWHGAGWTFVVYGALHGIGLSYEALTKKTRNAWKRFMGQPAYDILGRAAMFTFVAFSFIFFRSPSLSEAWLVVKQALHVSAPGYLSLRPTADTALGQLFGMPPWRVVLALIPIAVMSTIEGQVRDGGLLRKLELQPAAVQWGLYYALIAGILLFGTFGAKSFIYFQF